MSVTKNMMVQQMLGWFCAYPEKTISVPWFGKDYWHGGRVDNNNKTANNAKYSNCKGLNQETYESAYKICDLGHFEFCLHFEFYFYPLSIYLQAKHDLFCA